MPDQNTEIAVAADQGATSLEMMFTSLMEVVRDPTLSTDKLEAILSVQERMIDRQAMMEFNKARMLAMMEMPVISKGGVIKNKAGVVQSRYAEFPQIDKIVRPICNRHGLAYGFNIEGQGNQIMVTCQLSHIGGHTAYYGPMPLAVDTTGSKNATQGAGSAATYGKRHTLCAALNIVTEYDDDGRAAGRSIATDHDEPAWSDEVENDAQQAAINGQAAYAAYFQGISPMRKGWLLETGRHERFKIAAAEHGD